jgi:two-component system, OmpR family, response regulator
MIDALTSTRNAELLLVDDDEQLRAEMASYLVEHGFQVFQAGNAGEASALLGSKPIKLVVLDVMLPGEDGLSICRRLAEDEGPPVLMLSAMGDSVDRILGLELGADDYVVKPLPPRELLARVRAILRRRSGATPNAKGGAAFNFAGFRFDLGRRRLSAPNGTVLQLTPSELSILTVFVENPGRILTREELVNAAWGEESDVHGRAVDVCISRLRRKINGQTAIELIKTYRATGYMLDAAVTAG